MRKSILFVVALATLGFLAGEATAAPITLTISRKDATKICGGGAINCFSSCGSTVCDVRCPNKGSCTVTVYNKKADAPKPTTPTRARSNAH